MKEFKLEINNRLPSIRYIQFVGGFLTGLMIGFIVIWIIKDAPIPDFSALYGALFGLGISFIFFGFKKDCILTVNEEGIFTHPGNNPDWGKDKRLRWDSISKIELQKNFLSIQKSDGKTEKIKLPFYTKGNWSSLKASIKNLASKDVILSF